MIRFPRLRAVTPANNPEVILVDAARPQIGGLETWNKVMAERLRDRGWTVRVLAFGDHAHPVEGGLVCPDGSPREQARSGLDLLQQRARAGAWGVFLAGGYAVSDLLGLNLLGSPWRVISVAHGDHRGLFDWLLAGPPDAVVLPNTDLARRAKKELRRRSRRPWVWNRVHYIPHGVPVGPPWRQRNREAPLRLLAASRLDAGVKRPWDYILIARQLQKSGVPLHFRILGSGTEADAMRRVVREEGLPVEMPGALSRAGVLREMAESDIFLSTSETEAFGLSVAEAMGAGCAVVAADAGPALQELACQQAACLVETGNTGAFIAVITRWIQEEAERNGYARRGQWRIKRFFSEEVMLDQYERLLHFQVNQGGPAPGWQTGEFLETPAAAAKASGWRVPFRRIFHRP
jgi:glycosyltransferase involved in cell wall biosynthesis